MAGMLQRLSQGLRTGFAVALLMVAGYAMAQGVRGDHPDTYVVVRGDTLWDIAGKFLQHPWLWPEIWQANPPIANPHLIYPGDRSEERRVGKEVVSKGRSRWSAYH